MSVSHFGHWIKYCSCGKYISQCSCPAPEAVKTIIQATNGCRDCRQKVLAKRKGVKPDDL